MQYQDVCFRENAYWKFALNGPSVDDFSRPFSRTPELTNTGSFEKCWKLEPARALGLKSDRHLQNCESLRGLAPALALHIPNEKAGADFLKDWQNLVLLHHVPIQLPPLAPGQLDRMAGAIRCDVDKEKATAFLQYRYDHMQQAIGRNLSLNPIPLEL